MRLIVAEDYEGMSRKAAELIAATIAARPDAAVVLATGDTPMDAYRELAEYRDRGLYTSRLRVFQLDEYLGLGPEDPRSLYRWMRESVLDPLGIPEVHTVRLPGENPDHQTVCRAYDEAVRSAGGLDLAVLGLGPNGHLGFNEPPSGPESTTLVVDLIEESVESNARYWGGRDRVPRGALTAGMNVLLSARRTVLVVSGAHKRGILRRTLEGPATSEVPASYLRSAPDVTILADRDAAGTVLIDGTFGRRAG